MKRVYKDIEIMGVKVRTYFEGMIPINPGFMAVWGNDVSNARILSAFEAGAIATMFDAKIEVKEPDFSMN